MHSGPSTTEALLLNIGPMLACLPLLIHCCRMLVACLSPSSALGI